MSEQWTYRFDDESWLDRDEFFENRDEATSDAIQLYIEDCSGNELVYFETGRVVLITVEDLDLHPRECLDLELAQKISEVLEEAARQAGAVDTGQRFAENFGDRDLETFLFDPYRQMMAAHLRAHPLYRIVDIERRDLEGAA